MRRNGDPVAYISTFKIAGRTRKSVPEDFRRAQSSGEWPGARTTFCRGRVWGGRVDTDRLKDEEVVLF